MKTDLKEAYTKFYEENNPAFTFPPEWVVRTFLGNYPELHMDRTTFPGAKILDVGFGDGRCFPLLQKLGFELYGVELTESIIQLCQTRMEAEGIHAQLVKGNNTNLPFADESFDFLLASSSCYYVDSGSQFEDNLREYARVLKPGGTFIAAMPNGDSFVFNGAESMGKGLYLIKNDPYEVRNGYTLRKFDTREEIRETFSPYFDSFSQGMIQDDFYGCDVQLFLNVCKKKN